MANATNKRFADKLDRLFWFLIILLPLVLFYLCEEWSFDSFSAFMSENFSFSFIETILDSIIEMTFNSNFALTSYLSYVVGVELIHVFFDVIVFIPRLAHKWVGKAVQND